MTSISDLTDFDLEFVFSYLDAKDFINLADANMFLRKNVQSYLKKNFNEMIVLLGSPASDIGYISNIPFYFRGLNFVLKFLRIFGDQVKIMSFNYVNEKNKAWYVGSNVNKYCLNTDILIFRSLTSDLNSVFKNLSKVKFLFFEFCEINALSMRISKNFPNLEKLILFRTRINNSNNLVKFYGNLKLLIVDRFSLNFINVKRLRRVNPFLKIMFIHEMKEYLVHKQSILKQYNQSFM